MHDTPPTFHPAPLTDALDIAGQNRPRGGLILTAGRLAPEERAAIEAVIPQRAALRKIRLDLQDRLGPQHFDLVVLGPQRTAFASRLSRTKDFLINKLLREPDRYEFEHEGP